MFKNLHIYRLPHHWNVISGEISQQLALKPFQPCGTMDRVSRGWVAPTKHGDMVHVAGGHWLVAMCTEEKTVPASVVNRMAGERAAELEAQQGFRPGRKQLKEIKEQIFDELLPRAFPKRHMTYAWIDPVNGWLGIDASSTTKAEALIALLRDSLDDLPLSPFNMQLSPASAMTGWLASGEAPPGFTIDRECVLQAPSEEKSTVRYTRHPLEGEEIRTKHIANGKIATRLAMTWNDRLSFVLTDSLEVKRLAFLDIIKESIDQQAETTEEVFDAELTIVAGEFVHFLPDLATALGGEVKEGE